MTLLRPLLISLVLGAFGLHAAQAAPAQRWVMVDGRDGEHMAGFIDLKSIKSHRGMVRLNGLIVPRAPTNSVDHLRVSMEFDCNARVYKRLRVTQVDGLGEVLDDQQDPSPVTPGSGEAIPPAMEAMVCGSHKVLKNRTVLKSETAALLWARAEGEPPARRRPWF